MDEHFTYLLIDGCIIIYPLLQSYERRVRFLSQWKAIFLSVFVAGIVFLIWDEYFTVRGFWGFNERYISGVKLRSLPLEEIGFFVVAPYACLFIHEVLNHFIIRDIFKTSSIYLSTIFLLSFLVLTGVYFDRSYTLWSAAFASIMIIINKFGRVPWMSRFYLNYFVSLIPFMLINGWLTGMFTAEPVVWYNDIENLGLRLGTIPVEDAIYLFGYLLLVMSLYERFKKRKGLIPVT